MSKTDEPIQDYFEEMARAGTGAYAIAYAIMQLAGALDRIDMKSQNQAAAPGDLAGKSK